MRILHLLLFAGLCSASTVTFSPVPGTGPAVPVTVLVGDYSGGGVIITATVTGIPIGDLRGLFFDISGPLPSCANVVGGTGCQVGADSVVDLGNGATMQGLGHMFDLGIAIGTPGIGDDDIQSVTVRIEDTTTRASQFTGAGVRLTSVGPGGLDRGDSSKLYDGTPDGGGGDVPEPGTLALVGAALVAFAMVHKLGK